MSQSEESINLLSPSLDDRPARTAATNKNSKNENHQNHDDNIDTKSNGDNVSLPRDRATSRLHRETAFASRRDYTKDYSQPKQASDAFLRRTLPFRTSKANIRNIDSISRDMEVSLLLNSTVEVPRENGGMVLSQLTCLEGGTQMYTGKRDEESPGYGQKPLSDVGEEEREDDDDERETKDVDQEQESVDVFEFRSSCEKDRKKSTVDGNPKQDRVKAQAVGIKRRKKGPTEKALAECKDLSHSMEDRMENIVDMDNVNDNIDFDNLEDAKDPPQSNEQTFPNSQTYQPTSPQQHSPIQTNSPTHPPNSTQTVQQTILTNYTAIENMSRALTCPICCHSLKSASFLPCGHAFCQSCLSRSFAASATGSCPVCRLKCGKRSMMPIAQLDDIVRAYKGIMRAFGFAPVVFSKMVGMTQLSPEEDGEWEEEEKRESGGGWKRKKLDVTEALEHHQVVLSNHAAFANFQKQQAAPTAQAQTKPTSGNRMTKEELERINLTRRYQILARDQEAILQADKEALERATKRKQRIAEETAAFALNGGGKSSHASKDNVGDERNLAIAAPELVEDQPKLHPMLAPMESQDTFHTAKSGYSTSKQTSQPRRSSALTAPSPIILHDGNTAKKSQKDRSSDSPVGQLKESALALCDVAAEFPAEPKRCVKGGTRNQSLSTFGSPIVVHDGYTAKKKKKTSDNTPTPKRSGKLLSPLATDTENDETKPTKEAAAYNHCGLVDDLAFDAALEASQQSSIVSEESSQEPSANENEPPSSFSKETIVEGSVVVVQARTWPGINKHGGVGRVTRVDSSGHSKKYDVAYILGGKEKGVDESFVSLHETERSEHPGLTVAARVSRSAEKALLRQTKTRIAVAKETEHSVSIPIYNDDDLQHIPADVLVWAGIVRPAKGNGGITKRKKSKSSGVSEIGVPRRKRVLAESSTNVAPSTKIKKQKANINRVSMPRKRESQMKQAHSYDTLTSFQSATESLTTDEIVKRADARYAVLLSSDDDSSMTVYAITSSLSDEDTKLLSSLVKMLKSNNVTLKVTKDFKPGKTQLCITSASAVSSQVSNIVSKSRTLKVMRSALLGLPLLTPRWIESCVSDKRIVPPTGDMCVRSLPRKVATKDDDLASFAVAKYAAAADDKTSKLLNKCAVILCGEWKSTGQNTMKDLKVLLQDAGATIVNSESMASKMLVDISQEVDHFVFLCDDSHLDEDCGVSESLFNAGKLAISQNKRSRGKIFAVHFHWLFDCISCAKVMPRGGYEPLAPRTKALWSLCCEGDNQETDANLS